MIVFDWDGTLLDNSRRQHACFCRALSRIGVARAPTYEDFWARRREGTRIREMMAKDLSAKRVVKLEKEWLDLIEIPELLEHDRLYDGVVECLQELGKNHTLYLCSLRQDVNALLAQLDRFQVQTLFTDVFVASPVGRRTKLDLIRPVIERRTREEGSVIIGDSEVEVSTGREGSLRTIAVTYGNRSREFLERLHPDLLVDTVGQIPMAVRNLAGCARSHG